MSTAICTRCAATVNKLDLFPRGICVNCYAADQDAHERKMGTAAYMRQLERDMRRGFGAR